MKGFISKLWKAVALLLVCVMFGSTITPYLVLEEDADAKRKKEVTMSSETVQGVTGDVGTEDNPYTILEIVPHHDLAQMVWLSGETAPDLRMLPVEYKNAGKQYMAFDGTMSARGESPYDDASYDSAPYTRQVMKVDISTEYYSGTAENFNKKVKDFNDKDYKATLKFYGYTGDKYIDADGKITDVGRKKAQDLIVAYTSKDKNVTSFDDPEKDVYAVMELMTNNEVFKRYVIGIEDKTIRGIYKSETGKDFAYSSSMSDADRLAVKAKYNEIKARTDTKEKVLAACDNFHMRVIVATPEEVNLSEADPNTVVDTVAAFPETNKTVDNYPTYKTKAKNGKGQSLLDQAHMVFAIAKVTNTNSVELYNYTTVDAKRSTTVASENFMFNDDSTGYFKKSSNGTYPYDLTGKAAVKLLTRIRNENLPLITHNAMLNNIVGELSEKDTCSHNFARIYMLWMIYEDLSDLDIGRLSYNESAVYTRSNKSAEAYELYFDFDGTKKLKWGSGNFKTNTNSTLYGAKYPWIGSSPGIGNGPRVAEGSIFIFNGDENFNKAIMTHDYDANSAEFSSVSTYFDDNEICDNDMIPANILRAIAGFNGESVIQDINEIHILEVQPCENFVADDVEDVASTPEVDEHKQALELYYRGSFPTFKGTLRIDQVSSAEFIGMTDDLISEYNAIYFGMKTGKMNTDSSGNTVYNDTSLNGLVYLHTGDAIVETKDSGASLGIIRGVLTLTSGGSFYKASYQNDASQLDAADVYRYSGNDITKRMEERLEDYVKGNHAVFFDSDFFAYDSSGEVEGANEDKLDNSSYMYDFVKMCTKKDDAGDYVYFGTNVFDFGKLKSTNSTALETAVLNRCDLVKIKVISKPTEYTDYSNTSNNIGKVTETNHKLTFRFKIGTRDTTKKYAIRLYIDTYADGNFDETEDLKPTTQQDKQLDACEISQLDASDSSKEYTVNINLQEDYIGMVPWKLEVVEWNEDGTLNKTHRASQTGYTAVKRDEVEEIHVLQIMKYGGRDSDLNKSDNFNKYADLLEENVGFKIKISTTTLDGMMDDAEFFGGIATADDLTDDNNPFLKKDANGDDVYDMLLLGFDDSYGFTTYKDNTVKQEIFRQALKAYVNKGKAVLLSHDNLSTFNHDNVGLNGGGYTGSYMNYTLREYLGADRYGVFQSEEEREALGKDKPYKAGTEKDEVITTHDDWELLGKDAGTKEPPSESSGTVYNHTQIQGYTNKTLDSFVDTGKYYSSVKGSTLGWAPKTTTIKQANQGQITLFPYTIDEEYDNSTFNVAQTHCQYYQLDMERDDIVVWYTLSGGKYEDTGIDVRNNYYIYNTDNVTYTGMGHKYGDTGTTPTPKEMKLFINTMIAAYRASKVRPYAQLTNDGATTASSSSDKQYLYIDYDTFDNASGEYKDNITIISADLAKDPKTGEDCIRLEYAVLDNNLLLNKKAYITPSIWSHTTGGNVSRDRAAGNYFAPGGAPLMVESFSSLADYESAVLTSGAGMSLLVGNDVYSNVYRVNDDGSLGSELPIKKVSIGKPSDHTEIKGVEVECTDDISDPDTKTYATFIPIKYFEEDGTTYNDIYVSLSSYITFGSSDDVQVCFGDGNIVDIAKRELFDLK